MGETEPPRGRSDRAIVAGVLTLSIGIAISVGVWFLASSYFRDRAHDRLEVQAESLSGAIEQAASGVELDLRSVAAHFEASTADVDPEGFTSFIDRVELAPGLGGIAYAPLVEHDNLEAFVFSASEFVSDYSVYQLEDGEPVPVEDRPYYLPVLYFAPEGFSAPVGLDTASVPDRLPYITEALESGRYATTPIEEVAVFNERGYVGYQPILDDNNSPIGLVVGPVLLEELIAEAIPPSLLRVVDWTILESDQAPPEAGPGEGLSHVTMAQVGTQTWSLQVSPDEASSIATDAWRPAAALAISTAALAVAAALAVFWFWRDAGRRVQVENMQALVASKDQFVATVSHELRTPLAGVLGFAELLKDEGLNDMTAQERDEIIETIADQASDLGDIVEDLLVFARADHGTLATVSVPVDLAAQSRQVVERLSPHERSRVEITTEEPVKALADPGRVRQILRNLIGNAVAYGGDQIQVAIQDNDQHVSIRVSDNGDGVPEHDTERIFNAYQRAHAAGPTTGSLGLGLSVSRTLARHMNGDLTYSRQERLTCFELTLPHALGLVASGAAEAGTWER